mmetsp:Transcript_24437/g.68090  ORF Transcript_24437/g.68090 Transcript_24437/m.68090 type:complete len:116 (-) Transcript_24437:920-1267(-)
MEIERDPCEELHDNRSRDRNLEQHDTKHTRTLARETSSNKTRHRFTLMQTESRIERRHSTWGALNNRQSTHKHDLNNDFLTLDASQYHQAKSHHIKPHSTQLNQFKPHIILYSII